MISFQIITDPAVTLVRTLHMDLLNRISNPFVFHLISRNISTQPFIVCGTTYIPKLTKWANRIAMFFVFFFDSLIDLCILYQAQPRLLSISSSFFRKDASISARSFSARRILFSARSLSNSDISSKGLVRPRLSRRASIPPVSYFTV